jgi:hypothetical protein
MSEVPELGLIGIRYIDTTKVGDKKLSFKEVPFDPHPEIMFSEKGQMWGRKGIDETPCWFLGEKVHQGEGASEAFITVLSLDDLVGEELLIHATENNINLPGEDSPETKAMLERMKKRVLEKLAEDKKPPST